MLEGKARVVLAFGCLFLILFDDILNFCLRIPSFRQMDGMFINYVYEFYISFDEIFLASSAVEILCIARDSLCFCK